LRLKNTFVSSDFNRMEINAAKACGDRSLTLLSRYLDKIYTQGNFFFCCLLLSQWIAGIALAFFMAPHNPDGKFEVHSSVWTFFIWGGILAVLPVTTAIRYPRNPLTRHLIAISQMLFSVLYIYLSGERIETYFHVFGSLALLAMYRDWKVIVSATLVIACDHFLRGVFWQAFLWISFEDSILILACKKLVSELTSIAESQAMLESTKEIIEEHVARRTQDLLVAQEDLKAARDKAIELAKVKSEFLANMSHEIRTPLNGVIGTLDIVLESELNSEQQDFLRTGYISAKSLLTIINDILDVSKMEAGKFVLSPIVFDLDRFLDDCEKMMHSLISERNITLVINRSAEVPKYIYVDEVRLRQVLLNLIGNSVKFTDRGGGILLTIDAKQFQKGKIELHFSVSDSGRGIEKNKCDLIFEAFSQADNTIARKHGGTGLGLTISKTIVEMMGGHLSVKSKENVGSTFQFYIMAEEGSLAQVIQSEDHNLISQMNSKKSHILLAEDNPVNQKITAKLLQNRGFTVKIVENGALALEALSISSFDLVLMDVQMPVMDGIEAIKQIRKCDKAWSNIPIIALTAHAVSGDKENLLAIGANSYVSKPIDKIEFFREIAHLTQN
jgi:signal transduction histidine kinase/CheY-like chemotaxis protein